MMRRYSRYVDPTVSGVGVVDKAVAVLDALAAEPRALADLVAATGLSRATAHRLAAALEVHGLVARQSDGRYVLGPGLVALGRAAESSPVLAERARPALLDLRDATGESVQLYVRDDGHRRCVESLESPHGLRTIVAVGDVMPLDRGSAGRVLLGEAGRSGQGWVQTVGEREPGVASVSAPVRAAGGDVVAAVSVSGPISRMGRQPGRRYGADVVAAAGVIAMALGLVEHPTR